MSLPRLYYIFLYRFGIYLDTLLIIHKAQGANDLDLNNSILSDLSFYF